MDVQVTN